MNARLEEKLIAAARKVIEGQHPYDPSHDWAHTWRVYNNATFIAAQEGADLDVVAPASLFHDAVISPKNSPQAADDSALSAKLAEQCLREMADYPQEKVAAVAYAISVCSFSRGVVPTSLEAKVLQDADGLESVGIISLKRTDASGGQMGRPFYHPTDPFHYTRRDLDPHRWSLDLVFSRLLVIPTRLHTATARELSRPREAAIRAYLAALEEELYFSDPGVRPVIDAHRQGPAGG